MNELRPACERCGEPARVHITNEIGQEGVVRHLCIPCAAMDEPSAAPRERSLNRGAILICVGVFTLAITLFADQIGFGQESGFGWKQDIALALGAILVAAGALLRIATLLVIGVIIAVLTLLADWLRLGSVEGFGLKQLTGSLLGVVLIAAGLYRTRVD